MFLFLIPGNQLRYFLFLSTAKLTINVLDVNDNAPRFRPFGVANFSESILEGAVPGTTLLSVTAVDPDKGPNGQIIYQLLHLPRGDYIRLEDPSTGYTHECILISVALNPKWLRLEKWGLLI